ncbi:(Fe-S)-binding protein [Hydrogenophaga taeniospiralis]|uniref:(Fe-S)-binding protein n=1 Tax=Hydrogenophaga taeniospiralis TaxID=65656 RepID=UPI001CFA27A6|nr:(Fe-S)-binding protein [Hydrogenophaga taeniospiralis]MCB4366980.1 (Fe-S)-binding protein [Hydrogenophaga taeniospiralis]
MSLAHLVSAVFWLAVLGLLIGLARRTAIWRTGRSAAFDLGGLLQIPKRYFVDLHDVVAREPFVARAHVGVAGGTLLALFIVALNYGLGLYWRSLDVVLLIAGLLAIVGAGAMAWRRRAAPPRLSQGAWKRLPYSLLAFAAAATLVGVVALTGTALAPWLAGLISLAFAAGVAELALGIGLGGPMKHAVAGLLHLGLHPRPERFGDKRFATALKPLKLTAEDMGVGKPADFTWNKLLSFDACVQCGKCEAACPAFAAGQPLNPKKLIQDLVVGMSGRTDAAYAGSPYPGQPVGQHGGAPHLPIVNGLINADTLWSCTTCRACVQECPMLIEHVDAIVDMRRHITLVRGEVPNKGMEALEQLRETDTVGGFPLSARHHWAADLNVPVLNPGEQIDWLVLVGEGGFDMRYQRTLRAFIKTLQKAGLKFALLGAVETDCGDLARRLGDEAGFQRLSLQLIDTLKTRSFQHIVTPDPHIFHSLKNEYPAMGGRYDVWHHTQLLADLLAKGTITPTKVAGQDVVTYHDPCYLGRYGREVEAPRQLLKGIGIRVVEMERHAERGRCCGGGGGAPFTDIPGETRIPDIRIADARRTGAAVVAVACPNCTAMLEGVVGPRPEVLDIAELVARALEVA